MTDQQIADLGPAFAAYLGRYRDCFGQKRSDALRGPAVVGVGAAPGADVGGAGVRVEAHGSAAGGKTRG